MFHALQGQERVLLLQISELSPRPERLQEGVQLVCLGTKVLQKPLWSRLSR